MKDYIKVRINEELHLKLKEESSKLGLTVSSYVRLILTKTTNI
jgi:antitoxin component of RelBE/YafQ-DinJ toxin-antitoxin module